MADQVADANGVMKPETPDGIAKKPAQKNIQVVQGNVGLLTVQFLAEINARLGQVIELLKEQNG